MPDMDLVDILFAPIIILGDLIDRFIYEPLPIHTAYLSATLTGISLIGITDIWPVFLPVLNLYTLLLIAVLISMIETIPYTLAPATGFSMFPTLPAGTSLILYKHNLGTIEVGDIIAFTDSSRTSNACHRVIKKNGNNSYITKGDFCEETDGVVHKRNVTGRPITFGRQPLFIPLTPLSVATTLFKLSQSIKGNYSKLFKNDSELEEGHTQL